MSNTVPGQDGDFEQDIWLQTLVPFDDNAWADAGGACEPEPAFGAGSPSFAKPADLHTARRDGPLHTREVGDGDIFSSPGVSRPMSPGAFDPKPREARLDSFDGFDLFKDQPVAHEVPATRPLLHSDDPLMAYDFHHTEERRGQRRLKLKAARPVVQQHRSMNSVSLHDSHGSFPDHPTLAMRDETCSPDARTRPTVYRMSEPHYATLPPTGQGVPPRNTTHSWAPQPGPSGTPDVSQRGPPTRQPPQQYAYAAEGRPADGFAGSGHSMPCEAMTLEQALPFHDPPEPRRRSVSPIDINAYNRAPSRAALTPPNRSWHHAPSEGLHAAHAPPSNSQTARRDSDAIKDLDQLLVNFLDSGDAAFFSGPHASPRTTHFAREHSDRKQLLDALHQTSTGRAQEHQAPYFVDNVAEHGLGGPGGPPAGVPSALAMRPAHHSASGHVRSDSRAGSMNQGSAAAASPNNLPVAAAPGGARSVVHGHRHDARALQRAPSAHAWHTPADESSPGYWGAGAQQVRRAQPTSAPGLQQHIVASVQRGMAGADFSDNHSSHRCSSQGQVEERVHAAAAASTFSAGLPRFDIIKAQRASSAMGAQASSSGVHKRKSLADMIQQAERRPTMDSSSHHILDDSSVHSKRKCTDNGASQGGSQTQHTRLTGQLEQFLTVDSRRTTTAIDSADARRVTDPSGGGGSMRGAAKERSLKDWVAHIARAEANGDEVAERRLQEEFMTWEEKSDQAPNGKWRGANSRKWGKVGIEVRLTGQEPNSAGPLTRLGVMVCRFIDIVTHIKPKDLSPVSDLMQSVSGAPASYGAPMGSSLAMPRYRQPSDSVTSASNAAALAYAGHAAHEPHLTLQSLAAEAAAASAVHPADRRPSRLSSPSPVACEAKSNSTGGCAVGQVVWKFQDEKPVDRKGARAQGDVARKVIKEKVWLGTYHTAINAAVHHDVFKLVLAAEGCIYTAPEVESCRKPTAAKKKAHKLKLNFSPNDLPELLRKSVKYSHLWNRYKQDTERYIFRDVSPDEAKTMLHDLIDNHCQVLLKYIAPPDVPSIEEGSAHLSERRTSRRRSSAVQAALLAAAAGNGDTDASI